MPLDPVYFKFAAERGPVNPETIRELLNPEVLQDTIDHYGYVWLYAVSKYWPDELLSDKELCQLLVAREQDYIHFDCSLQSINWLPEPSQPVTAPSLAAALPSAASGLTTAAEPDVLGFRTLKMKLPDPSVFSEVTADSDINDWLTELMESCMLGRLDKSKWVMYASSFLSGTSRILWHAHRKAEMLTGGDYTVTLYDWQHFVDWCLLHLDIPNRVEIAFSELDKLRQTGTVADFKAKFDVLVIRTCQVACSKLALLLVSWTEA